MHSLFFFGQKVLPPRCEQPATIRHDQADQAMPAPRPLDAQRHALLMSPRACYIPGSYLGECDGVSLNAGQGAAIHAQEPSGAS